MANTSGNAYSVVTIGFWGRKFCKWEGNAKFGLWNSTSLEYMDFGKRLLCELCYSCLMTSQKSFNILVPIGIIPLLEWFLDFFHLPSLNMRRHRSLPQCTSFPWHLPLTRNKTRNSALSTSVPLHNWFKILNSIGRSRKFILANHTSMSSPLHLLKLPLELRFHLFSTIIYATHVIHIDYGLPENRKCEEKMGGKEHLRAVNWKSIWSISIPNPVDRSKHSLTLAVSYDKRSRNGSKLSRTCARTYISPRLSE